jgi:hypothetical protein
MGTYKQSCPSSSTSAWLLNKQGVIAPAATIWIVTSNGISSYFLPGLQCESVVGIAGHDQDVPKLSNNVPYDPFKVDIFTIGNVIHSELQAVGFSLI